MLSHVVNLKFIVEIEMRIDCDGPFFGQLIAFVILVNFAAIIGLYFFPTSNRRYSLGICISHLNLMN